VPAGCLIYALNRVRDAPLIPGQVPRVLGSKAAFYRLLDGYDHSLFEVLRNSDANAAICVKALQADQGPWAKNRTVKKMRVGDLAKLLIWEDRLPDIHALLEGINWNGFEDREISANMCTRHGDLHGENVRVDAKFRVMVIDYGSVDPLPSAIDAVTLELSPFFHPHGFRNMLRWMPGGGSIDWFDRNAFSALTSIPNHIHATRDWAHADGFGDREVMACAYIYVLRQLQFPKADKELARALAAGIVERSLQT
jgi:hypothetical protein